MTDISKMTQEQLKSCINNGGLTDAEVAANNSESRISAACDEFARRTGFQQDPSDPFAAQDIADIARSRNVVVTADALVEAYELRCASRLSQQDLKRVIQERER